MKRIHIFKAGTHTSAGGATLDFSEDRLKAMVDGYDPTNHEAPIVIGHPKDNGPAFGWVKGLEFGENGIHAIPHQLNDDFAEAVKNGSFKKVSASFYSPDSPNNPNPGNYYLRHVGFLGAQPPAIKGLQALEFSEGQEMFKTGNGEDVLIEFEEDIDAAWQAQDSAGIFRKLREFIIDKFSKEDADEVIPSYAIEGLERGAQRRIDQAHNQPNYSEGNGPMNKEEIAAMQAENAALKQKNTDFSEREEEISNRENKLKAAARKAVITGLITDGKILPAQEAQVASFMEMLEGNDVAVEFAEGDATVSKTGPDAFAAFLGTFPNQVDFNEHSNNEGNEPEEITSQQLAKEAQDFQENEAKEGRVITIDAAVQHVIASKNNS